MSKRARIPHYFPEEILPKIWVNLPVKSLGKCMCVCKAWNSLIKDPSFISSNLNNQKSSSQKDNLFLVKDNSYSIGRRRSKVKYYSLHRDDQEFSKYPDQLQLNENQHVIDSCNGLIFLVDFKHNFNPKFMICNPIIRKCVELPKSFSDNLHDEYCWFGLGFDSRTNDYKVLKISYRSDEYECGPDAIGEVQLYSLKKDCWKTLTPTRYDIYSKVMVFVCGVFHFMCTERIVDSFQVLLMGFHMSDEVLKEIRLPENLRNVSLSLELFLDVLPYDELSSIAMLANYPNVHDVWIMKKYGVVETWTKIFSFEVSPEVSRDRRILGFRKNGGLIVGYMGMEWRDPHVMEGNEIKNVKIMGHSPFAFNYVESLVLLDQVSQSTNASNSIKGATDDFIEDAAGMNQQKIVQEVHPEYVREKEDSSTQENVQGRKTRL